tara:strand:+ start:114 stop:1055 length:942 start_codon:yes stop_codon:yes gene_type:complete
MSKNIHIEHPEDSIFTGDLSVLDAFLMPLRLSLKIDGAPSIVWGRNPSTGNQFVGTKSVFNKKKIVICETPEDIEKHYAHKANLAHILMYCMAFLPITKNIYQGDFIGFGGAKNYRPNTLTYSFPEVVKSKIIMAPHTKYYAVSDLRDAIAMPLTEKLESGGHVKYVQPTAFINDDFDDGKNYAFNQCADMIEYAKNMATAVKFVDERTAKKIKININSLIREGKAVDPEAFAWAGLCDANLIELWHTVNEIKMMALGMCADNAEFETYANYTEKIKGEGYVMISRFGYFKLVNRREFSYQNFINPKFAASAL